MRIGRFAPTIISSILLILSIALCVLTNLDLIPLSSILFPISIVLVVVFAAITFFIIALYFSDLKVKKFLNEENIYNFGVAKDFYNYYVFSRRVAKQIKHNKKENKYIIRFSCFSNTQTISNHSRAIVKFNSFIADFLIKYFSKRSKKIIKNNASFCFYHDTFLIYYSGSETKLNSLLTDISNELYKINQENDLKLFVQPYFGVVEIKDTKSVINLISKATIARRVGQLNFQEIVFYEPSMEKEEDESIVININKAIENNEFVVYYQPKYNLTLKKFISSEALVRWENPKRGLLSPSQFVPQAEQMGLIHKIDMYIFERVCKDLQDCKRKGRRLLPVSVNFSLYEFYNNGFIDDLVSLMNKYNIPPTLIEIEITEQTTNANNFIATSILKRIKDLGIRILMDDFGVGYSNIMNIRKTPIDVIKIDKSFIDEIVTDAKTRSTVKFLIELCKTNSLESIAEGVNDVKQVEILKKLKCDTIQGYYYSKPLCRNDFEKFLLSNNFEKKGVQE